jgi:hypothetical protein
MPRLHEEREPLQHINAVNFPFALSQIVLSNIREERIERQLGNVLKKPSTMSFAGSCVRIGLEIFER